MSVTSDNLQQVRERIARATATARRAPDSVRLVAVTKTFPAAAVLEAMAAGQRDFGENYLQEAVAKIAEVARTEPTSPPVWHFIGPIQSNKTRAIAAHFDWVHSVDRPRVAERLSAQRDPARGPLHVLIEVNVDDEPTKSGVAPDDVAALARVIVALPNLALGGLMTVPAAREGGQDGAAGRRAPFARLRAIAETLRAEGLPCEHLSMGMSGDLEEAIVEGATMVRVGSAIFGARAKTGDQEAA